MGAVAGAELAEDRLDMALDCVLGDAQARRYTAVVQA
jgi:hypothetical protein